MMLKSYLLRINFSYFLTLILGILLFHSPNLNANKLSPPDEEEWRSSIDQLPVMFRENKGQWDKEILYKGYSPGWEAHVQFIKNGISLGVRREVEEEEHSSGPHQEEAKGDEYESLVWNLLFKNANSDVVISAQGKEDSRANYLIGTDPEKHVINVPDYRMIKYKNIYQGIDVNYYSSGKNLKYDYIIHPQGDINQLQMSCQGIEALNINEKGQLEITTAWGKLIEEIPESYQIINGQKKLVQVGYQLIDKTTFTFALSEKYDKTKELVIDPVALEWSTFVGGGIGGDGYVYDIAMDPSGNVYGVGKYTDFFPVTPGVFDDSFNGAGGGAYGDVQIFKLNATATSLIYATYLGGTKREEAYGVAVNAAGEVFITGWTESLVDFPTTLGAFRTAAIGGLSEVFVSRLNSTGTALIYSTYIGGNNSETGKDIVVNSSNEAFITGYTTSANFPSTAGSFQPALVGGLEAFVVKLNAAGSALVYSTFLGAGGEDVGNAIAINAAGEVFLAGNTGSAGFPTTAGAFDVSKNGYRDAYVAKINAAGSALIYSTFIGSTDDDLGQGIAINAAGEAYITGTTGTWYFPANTFPVTVGAYDVTHNGGKLDGFVVKLNSTGTARVYATYLGGMNDDSPYGIAVNADGEAYISGSTFGTSGGSSFPFPTTTCALDSTFNADQSMPDVFVSKLSANGSSLMYSTFMGGANYDYGFPKIILRGSCPDEVTVSCTSHSPDFPTTAGVYQETKLNGGVGPDQPAIFKLKPAVVPQFTYTPNPTCNAPVTFTDITDKCGLWDSLNYWLWDFGDGTTSSLQNPTHTYPVGGTYNVKLVLGCPMDSITLAIPVSNVGCCNTTINSIQTTSLSCYGDSNGMATVNVSGGGTPYTYIWSNGSTLSVATISGLAAGTHSVSVLDATGCALDTFVTILQPGALDLAITSQTLQCNGDNGGSASVNVVSGGTGPFTYLWNNTQTGADATGLAAGIYTVSVTDAGSCVATQTISIIEPPLLAITSLTVTNVNCNGEANGTTSITLSGGTPAFSYSWSNAQTNSSATGLIAGVYSVTVSDGNNCVATQTVLITEPSLLAIISSTVTDVKCKNGNDGTASVTADGGTGSYTYLWDNTQTSATATGLAAGIYSVTVTDANNCIATLTVSITEPSLLSITSNTVTDVSCNGEADGEGFITHNNGGIGPYTYLWSNTQTSLSATGLAAGIYSVSVTDANNCVTTQTVNVAEPLVLVADPTVITNVSCNGDNDGSASLTASDGTGPYAYLWNNGQISSTVNGLSAGLYSATVTDNNGCIATTSVIITEPLPLVTSTLSVAANCNQSDGSATVNVNGGTSPYSYLWSTGETATGITSTLNAMTQGIYSCTVIDANGCSSEIAVSIGNNAGVDLQSTGVNDVSCFGLCDGDANVESSGGASPYNYLWSDGQLGTGASFLATGLCAGVYTCTVTDNIGCRDEVAVTILQPTLLIATPNITSNVSCNGENDGSAYITASDGTAPYIYSWSNGEISDTAKTFGAGIYSVSVTDANNCVATQTVLITEPSLLAIASQTLTNVSCNGANDGTSSITHNNGGIGPYTYLWTDGQVAATANNLFPGIHTVTITDNNGCIATASVSITEPLPLVTGTLSVAANCNQSDGSATVNTNDGTAPYSYLWSTGETATGITSTLNALAQGIYSCTVSDANGCLNEVSLSVGNMDGVSLQNPISNPALCYNSCDGDASVTGAGGTAPYNYVWSNGQIGTGASSMATGLCAGLYTCTVTDDKGCRDEVSITINQPSVLSTTLSALPASCFGESTGTASVLVSGGITDYTYQWNTNPVQNTNTAINVPAGNYQVTVTDANGCSIISNVITVPEPPELIATITGPASVCSQSIANLSVSVMGGTTNYNYLWNTGEGTPSISPQPASTTIYTNTVTDANGCTSVSTYSLLVNPLPEVSADFSDSTGCPQLCINFTNTTPDAASLTWNFGDGTTSSIDTEHCYDTPGVYSINLTVTDVNGCSNTLTKNNFIVVHSLPIADFIATPPITTMLNGTIQFTDKSKDATAWNWNFGDVPNSASILQHPQFTYVDSGLYVITLIVSNANGCLDTAEQTVIVRPEFALYAPNTFTPNGDNINDEFIPQGIGIDGDHYELLLFDRWGNLIWSTKIWGKGWDGRANNGTNIAQQDVYVWKIVLRDTEGKKHRFMGHVNLVK